MTTPSQIVVAKTAGKKRHFSFTANEKVVATLQHENWLRSRGIITVHDHQWKFQRKGFWQKQLEITASQSPYTKTRIDFGWGCKFSVRAEDNNRYHFKSIGFWRRHYAWFDDAGQKLMELKSIPFSRRRRGAITLFVPPNQQPLWLMVIGWYQLVHVEQAAATAAAAS